MTPKKPDRVAEWKSRSVHTITLPSGMQVGIKIPNLADLLRGDAVPMRLRSIALTQVARELDPGNPLFKPDVQSDDDKLKLIDEVWSLYLWLVTQTVVDPVITEDDLEHLPELDKHMLAQIAGRERDDDALGVKLGVAPLSSWDTFRRFHECAEGCEACQQVVQSFSSARLGPV